MLMNWKILNNLEFAYKPNSPNLFGLDDALVGGAAFGIGSGLLSGIFGSRSQDKANQANLQAVRETNQANLDLYREQFADQYKLWQENNQYNSPANQMQRLRDAGLNPALMMQNGGAGTASAASVPSANPMQAPHIEPVPPAFNASDIGQNLAALAGGFNQLTQGQNENISNQYLSRIKEMELRKGMAETKVALQNVRKGSAEESLLKARLTMQNLENRLYSETFEPRKQSFELSNNLVRAQTDVAREQRFNVIEDTAYKRSLTALTNLERKIKPIELQNAISLAYSQMNLNASQSEVNYNQATKIFKEAVWQEFSNQDASIKLEVYKRSLPYVMQGWKENLDLLKNQNLLYQSERFGNYANMLWKPVDSLIETGKAAGMFYLGGRASGMFGKSTPKIGFTK